MEVPTHAHDISALDLGCYRRHPDESDASHPSGAMNSPLLPGTLTNSAVPRERTQPREPCLARRPENPPDPQQQDPVCLGPVEEPDMHYLRCLSTDATSPAVHPKRNSAKPFSSATLPSRETSSKSSSLCPSTIRFAYRRSPSEPSRRIAPTMAEAAKRRQESASYASIRAWPVRASIAAGKVFASVEYEHRESPYRQAQKQKLTQCPRASSISSLADDRTPTSPTRLHPARCREQKQ